MFAFFAGMKQYGEAALLINIMEEIIKFIKQYAQDHYNDGGWDVVVECWSDSDIRQYLNSCKITTQPEALKQFKRIVDVWADQQADAKNYG